MTGRGFDSNFTRLQLIPNTVPQQATLHTIQTLAEKAIHFCPICFHRAKVHGLFSYRSQGIQGTTFPWLMIEMTHIRRLPAEERVTDTDDQTPGRGVALTAEQNGVICIKADIQESVSAEQTVPEHCANTLVSERSAVPTKA